MSTNNNKKNGNHFEEEFCELLALHGFWAHNMAQNQVGQPADVIAVKNGIPVLIARNVKPTASHYPELKVIRKVQ